MRQRMNELKHGCQILVKIKTNLEGLVQPGSGGSPQLSLRLAFVEKSDWLWGIHIPAQDYSLLS